MNALDPQIILRAGGGGGALNVEVVGECSAELLNSLRRAKLSLLPRLRRHFTGGALYTPMGTTAPACFQCVHFDPSATDPAMGWGVCEVGPSKHDRCLQRPDDVTLCGLFLGGKLEPLADEQDDRSRLRIDIKAFHTRLEENHDRETLHLLREAPGWVDRLAELESAFLERWETGEAPQQEAEAVFRHYNDALATITDGDHDDAHDESDDLADSAVSVLRSAETIESLAARWNGLRRYLRRELPASAFDELEKLFRAQEARFTEEAKR